MPRIIQNPGSVGSPRVRGWGGVVLPTMLLVVSAALCGAEPIDVPPADRILRTLAPGHPRLLLNAEGFARLKQLIATDPVAKSWYADLKRSADKLLTAPPSKYEIPDGKRLLATSRRVTDRVTTLAMVYRMEGKKEYLTRAWDELFAASKFKDWNPSHFLDTAEMTAAFAIGYDWLYDAWLPDQKHALREAIVNMGLKQAMKLYPSRGWAGCSHNWNQVCNGGITMGALAIADEESKLSGEIVHYAVHSVQKAMASYAPDGGWPEGPGYWHYATLFNVLMLSALKSALGTDFGLPNLPGFSETGVFPYYMTGSSGLSFSFADCHAGSLRAPELLWLATRFKRQNYKNFYLNHGRGDTYALTWYDPAAAGPAEPLLLDRWFKGVNVVSLRTAWIDPGALFLGFKCGDNKANHSHLDLGSFVLDSGGVRWAVDIGSDNYNAPGYFGGGKRGQRWTYYRLRAEGHNTLVINPGKGPDQDPTAVAKVVKFSSTQAAGLAVGDLSETYDAGSVKRGVMLINRATARVQDDLALKQQSEVWWFMHTPAAIKVAEDGTTATLTQKKAELLVRIVEPAGAKFSVMEAVPLPTSPQAENGENRRVKKLAIHLSDVKTLRLVVDFIPDGKQTGAPAAVKPLDQW